METLKIRNDVTCGKCDNDLAACTCSDLEERYNQIKNSKFIKLGDEYKTRIEAQIKRQKESQSHTE